MFGELIGVWALSAWQAIGRPLPRHVGRDRPGRGTLMQRHAAHAWTGSTRRLREAAAIVMIETSPNLARGAEDDARRARAERIAWHRTVAELPDQPLIIIGNELFDAIPIRQYVKVAGRWRERAIGLDDAGELRFMAGCRRARSGLAAAGCRGRARGRDRRAGAGADGADGCDRRAHREQRRRRPVHRLRPSAIRRRRHAAGDQGTSLRGCAGTTPAKPISRRMSTSRHSRQALARMGSMPISRPRASFLLDMGLLQRAGRLGADADAGGTAAAARRSRAAGRAGRHGLAVQGAGHRTARDRPAWPSPPPIDLHPCPAAVSRPGTRIGTARRQSS